MFETWKLLLTRQLAAPLESVKYIKTKEYKQNRLVVKKLLGDQNDDRKARRGFLNNSADHIQS